MWCTKVLLNNNIPVYASRVAILKNATNRGSVESQQRCQKIFQFSSISWMDCFKDGPKYHTGALKWTLAHSLGATSVETVKQIQFTDNTHHLSKKLRVRRPAVSRSGGNGLVKSLRYPFVCNSLSVFSHHNLSGHGRNSIIPVIISNTFRPHA